MRSVLWLTILAVAVSVPAPAQVELLADTLIGGSYYDVTKNPGDNRVVVANGYGLMVFDGSDLAAIELTGRIATPGLAYEVFLADSHAYVADEYFGLVIIDISDPTAPTQVGSYEIGNNAARDVHVVGTTAYLTARSLGLMILDVSDPGTPILLGSFCRPDCDTHGVWVEDGLAYIAEYWHGLTVVDVSDPEAPFELGAFALPDGALDVHLAGDHGFVAGNTAGLSIVDVSVPDAPVELGFLDLAPHTVEEVSVVGDTAYLANQDQGLQIVDVSDPHSPTALGRFQTLQANGVVVADAQTLVADASAGLWVVDVSDPLAPTETDSYLRQGSVLGVFYAEPYLFAVGRGRQLAVVDVSDPSAPEVMSDLTVSWGACHEVVVRDGLAYVAADHLGLLIFDVADVEAPVELAILDTTSFINGLDLAGDHALLAEEDGLRLIDISVPGAPAEVGWYDLPARRVDWVGDHAYVIGLDSALHVLEMSDPAAPVELASFDCYFPGEVQVVGDRAYLAASSLIILDISDPALPTELGRVDSGYESAVWVIGDLAYFTTHHGLVIYDISDPADPALIGEYPAPGTGYDLTVVDDIIYMADSEDLGIYRFTPEASASPRTPSGRLPPAD